MLGIVFQVYAKNSALKIRVFPEALVYEKTYRLGDIAEIEGSNTNIIKSLSNMVIGKSPLPDKTYRISGSWLRRRIHQKLGMRDGRLTVSFILPMKIAITRAALVVHPKQLKRILTNYLKKLYSQYSNVSFYIHSHLQAVLLPKGLLTYKIARIGVSSLIGGNSTWKIEFSINQKPLKTVFINVKISVVEYVTSTKKAIPKGQKIRHQDLTALKKDISKEKVGSRFGREQFLGKIARRNISANETLDIRLVEKPLSIKNGARILIFYQTSKIYFTNIAIALKSGWVGDTIPVRVLKSKKVLHVEVMGHNRAKAF
ncbi:MAG: flagellar basal body P-ring formation protein FlgA [SAR324 cluster bacterium]|nr:flagellar basal body P-ring formation protein FlgA [SAR324 cluster bacterium]